LDIQQGMERLVDQANSTSSNMTNPISTTTEYNNISSGGSSSNAMSVDMLDTLLSLSKFYIKHGNVIDNKDILMNCYNGCMEYYGESDTRTIRSASYLATYYYNMKSYEETLPIFLTCLEKATVLYGDLHHETLTSLNNLGKLHMLMGKHSYCILVVLVVV
jgi:hypothetical protein